jgi:hypothetical protein
MSGVSTVTISVVEQPAAANAMADASHAALVTLVARRPVDLFRKDVMMAFILEAEG